MATEPAPKQRDLTLDIAKGLAIMLVIVGHILQDRNADFDDLLAFRLIYAFHMPLFIFVSGMVIALRPAAAADSTLSAAAAFKPTIKAIKNSALRLLAPFVVWTIIRWWVSRRNEMGFLDWMITVGKNPDFSLWFLIAVFYCHCLWQLWHWLVRFIGEGLKTRYPVIASFARDERLMLPISLIVTMAVLLPASSQYGIGYIKLYYLYFVGGAAYQLFFRNKIKFPVFLVAAFLFATLASFWYRLHPSDPALWLGQFIDIRISNLLFRVVVAGSGILVFMGLSTFIARLNSQPVKKALAYCGTASLGIYAFHSYLVDDQPFFILPLAVSLGFYWIVSRIPVARLLLLGERHQPAKT